MNNKTFSYIRVSDSSQSISRQLEAIKEFNIPERDIFIKKASGKNFSDRPQYQVLKNALRENDLLIIQSLDRLGRNYSQILEEWRDITKNIKANIKVLDMPILDTSNDNDLLRDVINEIILTLLSYVADVERKKLLSRQRAGIDIVLRTKKTKTGRPYGRPTIPVPDGFEATIDRVNNGEITSREAMKILGLKTNTYYSMKKKYENRISKNDIKTTGN